MYSAGEDRAVIGEFTVGRVLATDIDTLMKETGHADDPKAVAWFTRYYRDARLCKAMEAKEPVLYGEPITLEVLRSYSSSFRPPQNFIYLHRYPEIEVALKERAGRD